MNKIETLGRGMVLGLAVTAAGTVATEGIALAHDAEITATALCSDGIGEDSASEGVINFFRFGDQVGKTVTTSVNGVVGMSHLVTFEETHNPDRKEGEPDFSISLQAPVGHDDVKATWGKGKDKIEKTFEGDLLACPEDTPEDTVVVTPTDVVPADTTPAATGDTVVQATDIPPVPEQGTVTDTPILTPVTNGTLPATGKNHIAEKLGVGGTLTSIGIIALAIRSVRRRQPVAR